MRTTSLEYLPAAEFKQEELAEIVRRQDAQSLVGKLSKEQLERLLQLSKEEIERITGIPYAEW